MIEYSETTVFNVGAQTLVNTVNCMGVMGAGIALEFRLRYPRMYEEYAERCRKKGVRIGEPYLYRDEEAQILNFPTKGHWREPSKLEWIEQGLSHFVDHHKPYKNKSIAFPLLGCSHGGLSWEEVKPVMEGCLSRLPKTMKVWICTDTEKTATGIEGEMVKLINDTQIKLWADELNLPAEVTSHVRTALPLRRFRDLGKIKELDKDTYSTLFRHFYARAQGSKPPGLSTPKPDKEVLQLTFPF